MDEAEIAVNERIDELAEQALNEYSATYHNEAKIPEAYLKKFAELLVRECASFMNEYAINGDVRNGNDLLKHFGVEE